MFEQPLEPQPESQENTPVTKEEVLNAYAKTINGQEDGPAKDLLMKWIERQYAEIETIADRAEKDHALISFEVEKAELYFDTGFEQIALEELEGDGQQEGLEEMAWHRGEEELHGRILELIEKIKNHIEYNQDVLGNRAIVVPDLEKVPEDELRRREEQANADQVYELSAQIRDILNKKS